MFKKLYEDSLIPTRATLNSAGYDLYAHEEVILKPNTPTLVKTGVSCEMPNECFLGICSRSGLALKHNVKVANPIGIVDADYYPNEIGVILINQNKEDYVVKKQDRIAQGVLQQYITFVDEEVVDTIRKSGFGSSGK